MAKPDVTNRTLDKARREIENGNLWRAKEILQGAIRSESYNVQLFEMMGTVLVKMGDLPEAGKFLFLSGVRKPEYVEPIEIFLSKHKQKKPYEFVYLLPRRARLRTVSDYPQPVAQVLREMGCPEILKDENDRVYIREPTDVTWIVWGTIALIALALIVLGVIKLWEMIR